MRLRLLLAAVFTALFTALSAAALDAPAAAAPTATASTGEAGDLGAAKAVDGDPGTRWSSEFLDDQQLTVDLGEAREIAGVRIRWETAYGRDYDLLVSDDGAAWTRAAAVRDGDGGIDEVFFRPRRARHLRMHGLRRGTGWGFSIFEIEPLGPEAAPELSASSARRGARASEAMDGETRTAWVSRGAGAETLAIDLRAEKEVGGLEILWGRAHARRYRVEASADGASWRRVAEVSGADGGADLVFFEKGTFRALRLVCLRPRRGADRYAVREVALKTGGEGWSQVRHFEALLSRYPRGAFPRWLSREQEFWTIAGVPDDAEEMLVSEEGTVEPFTGAFSVMPFLVVDGRTVAARDVRTEQALVDGVLPLPSVRWTAETGPAADLRLEVAAVGTGAPGASYALVRYALTNEGAAPRSASIALAVRPLQLNPPWQHGGLSRIDSAAAEEGGRVLRVNGRVGLAALRKPDAVFFSTRRRGGDVHPRLARAGAAAETGAADPDGIVSAALRFDLEVPSGATRSVVVAYPLHAGALLPGEAPLGGALIFEEVRSAETVRWRSRLGGWTIRAPLPRLAEVVRSNLAYILLNRDHQAPQPGPRNYAKAWMRDGSISSVALLRYGMPGPVRRYLEWFTPLIAADGYVPPIVKSDESTVPDWARDWKEYDAFGEYVYAVRQYWAFTRDADFVRGLLPTVVRALDHQTRLVEERRTDRYRGTEYFGILPESNSHEGYFPAVHSYWDDFFAIRGYEDGAALADALAETATAERLRNEAGRFRADFYASMRAVIARDTLAYIPGCAEKGDFDPTSTSIAFDHCGEADFLRSDAVLGRAAALGFEKYFAEVRGRWTGEAWRSFTPYEVRNVEALVRLGEREKAAELLAFFLGEPVRPRAWNHLAEVVHPDPRTGSYIGDMPHTWVGADLANAARSLFVIEDESAGALVLAAGVPAHWLDSGVDVAGLPTWWGTVRYAFRRVAPGEFLFSADGDAAPPGGFVLSLPRGLPVSTAVLDGVPIPIRDGAVRLDRLPAEVRIQ